MPKVDLAQHADAMLDLLRDYAISHGILSSISGLLIVREVLRPEEPERPTHMAIVGESATTALLTLDCAKNIITSNLGGQYTITSRGVPSA